MSEYVGDPITWRVLEDVRDALREIKLANGFYTEIGLAPIALEAEQVPERDTEPHTVILAMSIDIDESKSTRDILKSEMDIVIEYTLPLSSTDNAQRVAHRGRMDVLRALTRLRRDIKERPRGLNTFQITGTAIQQPEDGAATVVAQVVARAGLTENFNPAT